MMVLYKQCVRDTIYIISNFHNDVKCANILIFILLVKHTHIRTIRLQVLRNCYCLLTTVLGTLFLLAHLIITNIL